MRTDALAILFPGQGVGSPASGGVVRAERPDLHVLACQLVGADPFERIADATRFSQPAVYCASIAGLERFGRPTAAAYAGHSLGEIAALTAAGAISDHDGLRIAVARGRLCQGATDDAEPGAMLAVNASRAEALALATEHGLELANHNSPEQLVLSGPAPAIESARVDARARNLRAKRLAVVGAFHSSAMRSAAERFGAVLDEIEFAPTPRPVLSGVSAAPFASDPRPALVASLTTPVRWVEVMKRLRALGVERYCDVGPGRVLAKLTPQILGDGVEVEAAEAVPARV